MYISTADNVYIIDRFQQEERMRNSKMSSIIIPFHSPNDFKHVSAKRIFLEAIGYSPHHIRVHLVQLFLDNKNIIMKNFLVSVGVCNDCQIYKTI